MTQVRLVVVVVVYVSSELWFLEKMGTGKFDKIYKIFLNVKRELQSELWEFYFSNCM